MGVDARTLARILRGNYETARAIAQPMLGDVFAGGAGLGQLALGRGTDAAADAVRRVQEDWAYTPETAEGQAQLGAIGGVIEKGAQIAKRVPGAGAAQRGWEGFTATAPLAGAIVTGVAGAGLPETRATTAALRVPRSVERLGTAKAAREAATAKRLAQQQAEAERLRNFVGPMQPTEPVRAKGGGGRAAVAPDIYRTMYATHGTDAVIDAASRGLHLKPQPGGGYAGAPRTVQTGAQLGGMRRALDQQLEAGATALEYADPERLGTWYDRAKAAQAMSNELYQLPRSLEGHAVYSAGVAPESELGFALRHHNAEMLGTGERTARPDPQRVLQSAVEENRPAKLGLKISEYGNKNNPYIIEAGPFGVNDFRMAQAFGYTDPYGNPWTQGVTTTMHPFMDAETALMVARANERQLGGRTDWTGAKAQEVPWVLNKAEDIYSRGRKGRFKGGVEGKVAALREANNTIGDYFPKHTFSATYEQVPGKNTGHVPQVLDAPFEERAAYGREGSWAQPAPEGVGAAPGGEVGAGDRDILYSALRLRQLPTIESVGNYRNSAGAIEQNPLGIARPLVDFANVSRLVEPANEARKAAKAAGASRQEAKAAYDAALQEELRKAGRETLPEANEINEPTMRALEAAETFRGVMDAQEAAAGNLPVTMSARKGKRDLLIERETPRTPEEMQAVVESLRATGVDPELLGNISATNRGVQLFTSFLDNPARAVRQVKEAEGTLGGNVSRAATESVYLPAMSTAEEAGQGIATSRVLEAMARAPEEVPLAISESEAVRKALRAKTARDAALPGAREDIQRMRQFFSEKDWAPVAALIRKGMKPAAAMAALGYSLEGMAAENDQ